MIFLKLSPIINPYNQSDLNKIQNSAEYISGDTKMILKFNNLCILIVVIVLSGLIECFAEVNLDGTLGPKLDLAGPNYQISHEHGLIRGGNLFHSFEIFNLSSNQSVTESALFTGPQTITNIISRVTGGSASEINGIIKSEIPGANFYLLNPAGIMFGPNAQLDIDGSTTVSTADYIQLGNEGQFFGINSEQSSLSIAPPSAFGFLNPFAAAITIQDSVLTVKDHQSLSMIGGDIDISGGELRVSQGNLYMVSVASSGITDVGFDVTNFSELGQIKLFNNLNIDLSGEGGGDVKIRSKLINMNDVEVSADSLGAMPSGDIDIEVTENLILDNTFITSESISDGNAGTIRLKATDIDIRNQSIISGSSFNDGNSGNIDLSATDIALSNNTEITVNSLNSGKAGIISLRGNHITLDNATVQTQTSGTGRGGLISVNATENLVLKNGGLIDSANIGNTIDPGKIEITAGHLAITGSGINSSGINTSSLGDGDGGNISIETTKSIVIDGKVKTERFPSRILAISNALGNSGNISINTPLLIMINGASISTSTNGDGNGGNIKVIAETLSMAANSSISSKSTDTGTGKTGTINLFSEVSTVIVESLITTEGVGKDVSGGGITIKSDQNIIVDRSDITSQSESDGGNISVTALNRLQLGNATISAEAGDSGGNIVLNSIKTLVRNSVLKANSIQGNGGNININSEVFLITQNSLIDASSVFGLSGNIEIPSPDTDIARHLTELPKSVLRRDEEMQERCTVKLDDNISSFIVGGRRGSSIIPGEILPGFISILNK